MTESGLDEGKNFEIQYLFWTKLRTKSSIYFFLLMFLYIKKKKINWELFLRQIFSYRMQRALEFSLNRNGYNDRGEKGRVDERKSLRTLSLGDETHERRVRYSRRHDNVGGSPSPSRNYLQFSQFRSIDVNWAQLAGLGTALPIHAVRRCRDNSDRAGRLYRQRETRSRALAAGITHSPSVGY